MTAHFIGGYKSLTRMLPSARPHFLAAPNIPTERNIKANVKTLVINLWKRPVSCFTHHRRMGNIKVVRMLRITFFDTQLQPALSDPVEEVQAPLLPHGGSLHLSLDFRLPSNNLDPHQLGLRNTELTLVVIKCYWIFTAFFICYLTFLTASVLGCISVSGVSFAIILKSSANSVWLIISNSQALFRLGQESFRCWIKLFSLTRTGSEIFLGIFFGILTIPELLKQGMESSSVKKLLLNSQPKIFSQKYSLLKTFFWLSSHHSITLIV